MISVTKVLAIASVDIVAMPLAKPSRTKSDSIVGCCDFIELIITLQGSLITVGQIQDRNNLMLRTIGLLALVLVIALAEQGQDCSCKNDGECLVVNGTQTFCSCKANFIDKQCSTQGFEIHSIKQEFDIGSSYSYYYASLNTSDTYLIQMYFCPTEFQRSTRFQLFIEFQKKDNSLSQHFPDNEAVIFLGIKHQCLLYRSVVAPPYLKQDGVLPKLVVRLRHVLDKGSKIAEEVSSDGLSIDKTTNEPFEISNSKMAIVVYSIPLMEFQSLTLAEHLLIFLLSTFSLTVIAVVVFKGALRRRENRYHLHAARPANTIAHFDHMMPAVYCPQRSTDSEQNIEEEEEQCMICLLGVSGTETRRTPCRHIFHKECIDEWGIKSLTCPFCRASLQNPRFVAEPSL